MTGELGGEPDLIQGVVQQVAVREREELEGVCLNQPALSRKTGDRVSIQACREFCSPRDKGNLFYDLKVVPGTGLEPVERRF